VLMIMSFIFSLMVLSKGKKEEMLDVTLKKSLNSDLKAAASASTGMVFCILGLVTGSVWARFTWGTWWVSDPQLNGAMVVFIVYAAYFILRSSIPDEEKKARLSAIFNIFAFVLMVVLLMVMPRFTEGLHPGKSGNPAFSKYDLDSSLRTVFYPACAGFILLGYWLYNILFRIKKLESDYEI
ncbi:MAG: cytochrome c biogenesis protein CcsA, partial [Flavobacteriales bacterium]